MKWTGWRGNGVGWKEGCRQDSEQTKQWSEHCSGLSSKVQDVPIALSATVLFPCMKAWAELGQGRKWRRIPMNNQNPDLVKHNEGEGF